jgi:succinate dehydrogenase / fumarate reductase membrane anchor subunit
MAGSMRTPLGRVRGLGSAKDGVGHFIQQRVTALALAVLVPWFLISLATAMRADHAGAVAWVANPLNAVLLSALVIAGFNHMRLGLQTVIEDYITGHGAKMALLIANTFVSILGAIAALLAIARIFVSGA